MSSFENRLSALDEQLEAYEPFKRWAIYLGISIGIIVISWVSFASDMLHELKTVQEETRALESKIKQNSPEAYQNKISGLNRLLNDKELSLIDLKNKKELLLLQMSQSKGLVFDNRQYADTLDLLLKRSVELGLNIESMHSENTDEVFYGRIKKFKTLIITGSGKFRSIAAFLSFIEEQKTLVKIEKIQIRSDEKNPSFEATVLYLGAAL